MEPKKVFIGGDPRQFVSYTVLQHSIITRSSTPVQITPLVIQQLPLKRQGLTPFTYSRYLVPWLCNYEGWAVFMDADMLVMKDINALFEQADDKYAVMVSKNALRYEWTSVMLFNCAKCKVLAPEYVETTLNHSEMDWVPEDEIGELTADWNHLVGYDQPRSDASLVHFTQGGPMFPETKDCEYAREWRSEWRGANSHCDWKSILGTSSHATRSGGRSMPKLRAEPVDLPGNNLNPEINYGNLSDILQKTFAEPPVCSAFSPNSLRYKFGVFGVREWLKNLYKKVTGK